MVVSKIGKEDKLFTLECEMRRGECDPEEWLQTLWWCGRGP